MKLGAFMLLCIPLFAQAQSLAEAVEQALIFHPQLQAGQQQIQAQIAEVQQQQAQLKPHVMLTGEWGRSRVDTRAPFPESGLRWPNQLSLVVNQSLYSAGALDTAVDMAKLQLTVSETAQLQRQITIAMQTIIAYAAIGKDQSLINLYQQTVNTLSQAQQDTVKRFNAGEVTRTDIALADARLAEAKAQLSQAQAQLVISEARFQQLTGQVPQQISLQLPNIPLPANLEAALVLAQQSPRLQSQMQQVQLKEKAIQLAESDDKARINLQARASSQDNTDFGYERMSTWGVFVQAQLPLYQGGRPQALIRSAQAEYLASQQQLIDERATIQQDMTSAWQHWQAANAQVPAYQAQVQAAQIALLSTQKELQVGTRTTLDLLNAERELLAAKINLLLSEQERGLASYQVLSVIGDLSVLTPDTRQLSTNKTQETQYAHTF
ncbi:TolC family protein [Agitococcus lubricus]|uniref:Outer membrane protein n=1 Tax=Agitococcus lubricus TaxID=1077255 RepID=A0A2T5IYG4_9GAMM|nr:TolC family protein [Agitococcus lubricus]PTQ89044.1 outer membrane protein [Agitococcus lubricus]